MSTFVFCDIKPVPLVTFYYLNTSIRRRHRFSSHLFIVDTWQLLYQSFQPFSAANHLVLLAVSTRHTHVVCTCIYFYSDFT